MNWNDVTQLAPGDLIMWTSWFDGECDIVLHIEIEETKTLGPAAILTVWEEKYKNTAQITWYKTDGRTQRTLARCQRIPA